MGDSCFNSGMKSITKAAGDRLGVEATCIPTAGNWVTDTIGGFLKNMDASVDYFAKRVKADPRLANGFNAFGLSQGGYSAIPLRADNRLGVVVATSLSGGEGVVGKVNLPQGGDSALPFSAVNRLGVVIIA
jgi:hypothetical protein